MNHRIKTTLRAPDGVTESIIEGSYYWPDDESGEVQTTNPGHLEALKRHGYVVTGEINMMPPAAARGPIEVDELGRGALAGALQERGLSFPESATRGELADIAEAWNQARRRGRMGATEAAAPRRAAEALQPAAAPTPRVRVAPPATAPSAAAAAAPADPDSGLDFDKAAYDELKGWLSARGVGYAGNASKKDLRAMAVATYAEMMTAKTKAA